MSSNRKTLYTNDDWRLEIYAVDSNGDPVNVPITATVEVAIVSKDDSNTQELIPAIEADPDDVYADWSVGHIFVDIPRALTNITTYGNMYAEMQITDTVNDAVTTYSRAQIFVKKDVV